MRRLSTDFSSLVIEEYADYGCSDSRIANLAVGLLMVLGGIAEFFPIAL